PSVSSKGVTTCQPARPPSVRPPRNIASPPNRPSSRTRRNSSRGRSSIVETGCGGASSCASIRATSSAFQSARWSCQRPSPIRTGTTVRRKSVGVSPGRKRKPLSPAIMQRRGAVPVLLQHEQGLDRAQQADRRTEDQRRPDHEVKPVRRRDGRLEEQCRRHHQKTEEKDQEDRRTVTGIMGSEVQATCVAPFADVEEAAIKRRLSATRAPAAERDPQSGRLGLSGAWRHQPPEYQDTTTHRHSHTTSTKCQYQAAASKPKWCCGVKCPLIARNRQTARKMVPTMTWKPWKPVVM